MSLFTHRLIRPRNTKALCRRTLSYNGPSKFFPKVFTIIHNSAVILHVVRSSRSLLTYYHLWKPKWKKKNAANKEASGQQSKSEPELWVASKKNSSQANFSKRDTYWLQKLRFLEWSWFQGMSGCRDSIPSAMGCWALSYCRRWASSAWLWGLWEGACEYDHRQVQVYIIQPSWKQAPLFQCQARNPRNLIDLGGWCSHPMNPSLQPKGTCPLARKGVMWLVVPCGVEGVSCQRKEENRYRI